MKKIITEREIKKFKRYLLKTEKSSSTIEKYVRDVSKLQDYVGKKPLTKQLILQYKNQLEQQGVYKVTSINSFITAVNCFCTAMNWKELCIKTIKVQRNVFELEEKELTMQEYRKMVTNALESGNEQTALIIQTIAGTGIRVSELEHIDVECLNNGVADIYNKGKVRRILLPSTLQTILKRYAENENIEDGIIFQNRKKQPIDRREIWRRMKKIAEAADVPLSKAFPHNLRHLFAKKFYEQTGDIAKLADVLGHSSIETTRIYIKSTGKEHKRQLDMMDMIFDCYSYGDDEGEEKGIDISENENIWDENNKNVEENKFTIGLDKKYSDNPKACNKNLDCEDVKNSGYSEHYSDYERIKDLYEEMQNIWKSYKLTKITGQENVQSEFIYTDKFEYSNSDRSGCVSDTDISNEINIDKIDIGKHIKKTRSGIIIASEWWSKILPFTFIRNITRSALVERLKFEQIYIKALFYEMMRGTYDVKQGNLIEILK